MRWAFGGAVALAACALAAGGCSRDAGGMPRQEAQPVLLGPESVAVVERRDVQSGPELSGTLRAQREATLRAEVGGSVVEVRADGGVRVEPGQILARIEQASLGEQLSAARSAVASARNAVKVAEAEAERSRMLAEAGALAPRDAERTESSLEAARAQLADAQARLAGAEQQTSRTAVRAPFAGIVSARQVSTGDVVAPGTPLFTVIDPRRLQFEASVPAERLAEAKVGAPVHFRVTGFGDRVFVGKLERVNPAVDPATGQVRVYVDVPNEEGGLIAGLYAFGRIAARTEALPAAPSAALDRSTDPPTVVRVAGGKAARVGVKLALEDELAGVVGFASGVSAGDVLVVGPARSTLADGTPVQVERGRDDGRAEAAGDATPR
jgi:RND family efflux transporter MFP subunit